MLIAIQFLMIYQRWYAQFLIPRRHQGLCSMHVRCLFCNIIALIASKTKPREDKTKKGRKGEEGKEEEKGACFLIYLGLVQLFL